MFSTVVQDISRLDLPMLTGMADRMVSRERVKAETEDEQLCFKILNHLDHIGGHVKGSLTSKKIYRINYGPLLALLVHHHGL
jgi:hypothetical protein